VASWAINNRPCYAADDVVSLSFSSSQVQTDHGRENNDHSNEIEYNNNSGLPE